MKRFGTTDTILETRTLNGASFETIGTADTNLKTRMLNSAFWLHSKLFGTAEKKNESKDGKWCILTASDTIWNCSEHFENKDAK